MTRYRQPPSGDLALSYIVTVPVAAPTVARADTAQRYAVPQVLPLAATVIMVGRTSPSANSAMLHIWISGLAILGAANFFPGMTVPPRTLLPDRTTTSALAKLLAGTKVVITRPEIQEARSRPIGVRSNVTIEPSASWESSAKI